MKQCPYCAEEIQDAALVCRFCGRELSGVAAPAGGPSTDAEYISLNQQLTSLRERRARRRPGVPFIIGGLCLILGVIFSSSLLCGGPLLLVGVAGLLAGTTELIRLINLDADIRRVTNQILVITKSRRSPDG